MNKNIILLLLAAAVLTANLPAQDFGFGFGDDYGDLDSDTGGSAKKALTFAIGGEISASITGYFNNFLKDDDRIRLQDVFSGRLNFTARTSFADGVVNLRLKSNLSPVDEAYIRLYFGSFEIEGGLRKLTWGKSDSMGPLDVINPMNYSELTGFSDTMNLKIARPLIHASYRIGSFSKIEAVFVPTFEPLRYAEGGRWVPAQMKQLDESIIEANQGLASLNASFGGVIPNIPTSVSVNKSDTKKIEYAQAGVRFTTTVGSTDIGFQYYYGRLTRPAVSFNTRLISFPPFLPPTLIPTAINFDYNPYHQIGTDWAQVLFGFNFRAELALNITGDLKGDDGSVYNPAILSSLGFDRDLVWGINLNFQINESLRLMNDKISDNPMLDIEADTNMTSTQVITAFSKKFLRDELETRIAFIWEIEDNDFLLLPSLIWTRDAISAELSFGVFGGDEKGQFGQYKDNSFVKIALTYSF